MKIQQDAIDKEKDRQLEIEVALIKAEASDADDRLNIEMEKMQRQFELKERELNLKQQALDKEGDLRPDGV